MSINVRTRLRAPIKWLLRRRAAIPFVAFLVARSIRMPTPAPTSEKDGKDLTLLVFSRERWEQDLQSLARIPGIRLVELPTAMVLRINNLFDDPRYVVKADDFYLQTATEILDYRNEQIRYLQSVVWWLRRMLKIDAAVTCTYRYVREALWAVAFDRAGLPYIGWHKEFTVLEDRQIAQRVEETKARRFKFFGTHLCCVNDMARDLFIKAEVAKADQISKVGLLRADNLFQKWVAAPSGRPRVVLFSFGHLTGPFPDVPMRNYYFSRDDDFGFIELFRSVHADFADLARRNPGVDFLIKPKNVERGWIGEIESVVRNTLGVPLSDIRNCRIVSDSAPDLMRGSLANVVLNSTTAIESRILGCNTIIPAFAEAAGIHRDMIYFRDYFDLFAVAETRETYLSMLEAAIAGGDLRCGTRERLRSFLDRQIGNPDGMSAQRLAYVVRQIVSGHPSALGAGEAPSTASLAEV